MVAFGGVRSGLRAGLRAGGLALAVATASAALPSGASPAAATEPPRRVVSTNLCTDQLALMIAAPGQVVSVSFLAADPTMSVTVAAAAPLPLNHGRAEEVFAVAPDLVLSGVWASSGGVALVERLGVRVERFAPETTFADVTANIRRMGRLLGREAVAEALAVEVETGLARLLAERPTAPPTAVVAYPGGRTAGAGLLASAVLDAAGYRNLAAEHGIDGLGKLPLELLLTLDPDVIVVGTTEPDAAALSYDLFRHPAIGGAKRRAALVGLPDRTTVCGTPATLDAVRRLAADRARLPPNPGRAP